jgi:hypothetical protein
LKKNVVVDKPRIYSESNPQSAILTDVFTRNTLLKFSYAKGISLGCLLRILAELFRSNVANIEDWTVNDLKDAGLGNWTLSCQIHGLDSPNSPFERVTTPAIERSPNLIKKSKAGA